MIGALTAAALTLSTITIPPAADPPPTGQITIDVVTVNGSGCRQGSAAIAVSPDNKAFTVTYSDYLAQVGPQAKPTDFRKNCQLNLKVNVPGGFTYGIAQADYRGFAQLEKGARGTVKASYYFQGMSDTDQRSKTLNGAMSDNWQVTHKTDIASIIYHPCGEKRNFNINTELRVDKGTSDPKKTSFMAMDSTDGSIETIYQFAWKKCPKP
ncbi:DUF4360 domain-containing protein [Lentzea sp. NPDC004782]|uniref:DUF4360 domain-containing protein n=1 Tax=Lentzea sp. NPDC004782 TaxID=3154458 RepID=UPI0033B7631A